jgi:hypothetical protein
VGVRAPPSRSSAVGWWASFSTGFAAPAWWRPPRGPALESPPAAASTPTPKTTGVHLHPRLRASRHHLYRRPGAGLQPWPEAHPRPHPPASPSPPPAASTPRPRARDLVGHSRWREGFSRGGGRARDPAIPARRCSL